MKTREKNRERSSFRHIKKAERLEIAILLEKKYSHREIAKALGRDHTAVSREISRNSVNGTYNPHKAQHKARVRRMKAKYQGMKIVCLPSLISYVAEKMKDGWSPDVIAGRIKEIDLHIPYASGRCIYKWLYSARGQYLCKYLASHKYRRRKRKKKATKELIPNRVGIEMRPQAANDRTEYGHLEGDTIVSGKHTNSTVALSVLCDRKARYHTMLKIPNLKPTNNATAIRTMMQQMNIVRTITFDNGIENIQHEWLGLPTYFCNPYSSWEKGSIENINGIIRRYVPKGSDISQFSDTYITAVETRINSIPRKILCYKTPSEVMMEERLTLKQKQHLSGAIEG